MLKRVRQTALMLAILLLFVAITACSQATGSGTKTDATTVAASTGGSGIAKDKIKIGAILNTSKEDGGWSQTHNDSLMRLKEELGLKDDQVVVVEEIPEIGSENENAIEMLISDGCNIIFAPSAGHTDAIGASAKRHPDVFFHQFEGKTLENCANYTIRDYEAIFVTGYAAAKMSDVNELGFQAAQPTASVVRAINAWAAGAKYANPEATVKVVWTNSWYDPATEKEGANSLLDSGIKCLGYHGSTTAVMQAAAEKGGYATGFHIDMKDYAPKAVLTSFMWNWTPIYVEFVNNVINGTWTNATLFKGLESGCAAVAPFNETIMDEATIKACRDVAAKVEAGEIKVFVGPLKDNKGKEVLAEGKEFTDEEWIGMMYLADNVIGDLP